MSSWFELTEQERSDIIEKFNGAKRSGNFDKLNCEVKVKLDNGRMFEFTPFKVTAGVETKFKLTWIPLYDHKKPYINYMNERDVFYMVATQGIESDNIKCLILANFDTNNMKLNMNMEDDRIWTVIKHLADKYKRDVDDIDDEYKQQLIKGYRLCKGKVYNFKSVEEEETYFSRHDIAPEEEVYYYEFVVKWSDKWIEDYDYCANQQLKLVMQERENVYQQELAQLESEEAIQNDT